MVCEDRVAAVFLKREKGMFFDIVGILMFLWMNFLETNQVVNLLVLVKSLL